MLGPRLHEPHGLVEGDAGGVGQCDPRVSALESLEAEDGEQAPVQCQADAESVRGGVNVGGHFDGPGRRPANLAAPLI